MELPSNAITEKPNRTVLENSGFRIKEHQKAFLDFLRFLKGNLQGQTCARVDQSWASQNIFLQECCRLVFPDVLIRYENQADELAHIENDMGLQNWPLDTSEEDHFYILADIYDAEMDSISRVVYAHDYVMYGFENWG